MTFGFLAKMENRIANIHNPALAPFSLKNDALPLNSLFWSPPSEVHRFDASDMAVPGLYISWLHLNLQRELDTINTISIFDVVKRKY